MWEHFLSFFVSPEQTKFISSPLLFLAFGNFSQRVTVHGTSPDPGPSEHYAPRLQGWLQQRSTWRHTQLKDKAHWFLPDREVGGGCQSNAWTSMRERERNVDLLLMDLLPHCAQIFYLHTCETADGFPYARVLYGWCRVSVTALVPNVHVNAILPYLSGQWEAVHCSSA